MGPRFLRTLFLARDIYHFFYSGERQKAGSTTKRSRGSQPKSPNNKNIVLHIPIILDGQHTIPVLTPAGTVHYCWGRIPCLSTLPCSNPHPRTRPPMSTRPQLHPPPPPSGDGPGGRAARTRSCSRTFSLL